MSDDLLSELDPPTRPDFRRAGRGVPLVLDSTTGKFVRYSRSSNAGKVLDDESALTDWRVRTVTYGASQRPDLMATVSTLHPVNNKREIRDIAEECLVSGKGRERSVTGSAVHRMLDLVDAGDDWTPAPNYQAAVDSYVAMRDHFGLVVVDIECHCVNDAHRLAGTMDRRYRTTRALTAPDGQIIPIGSVIAGDTKTGRTLEYAAGSYATQLAAYVDSVRYDVETDTRTPFDPPTFPDWAFIFHVAAEDGRCDVYWIDINAGRMGLALASSVRAWRKRTDLIQPAMAPLRVVREEPPAADERPPEAATTDENTAVVREWVRERVAAVLAHEAARTELLRKWPVGVPGLKHEGHTMAQLDAIDVQLTLVEAKYQMPFGRPDPRKVKPRRKRDGRPPSDTWAKPSSDDAPDAAERESLAMAFADHPRRALLMTWSKRAMTTGIDVTITNRQALAHALYEFAMQDVDQYPDEHLTEILDGCIRALGYTDGIDALGRMRSEDAPLIMSAAFMVTSGEFVIRYVDGKPVVFPPTKQTR